MKIQKNILIKGKHHKPILTDFIYKENNFEKPIVIFCHGYKGYKDWGAWNIMGKEFAKNNLFFVKFNFSHNGGTIKQPIDFPDLEAFGNNNFSIELDDLEAVLNFVTEQSNFKTEIDKNNIILIGHSRGGGIVMLKASHNSKITNVISWAGISDIESRFPKGKALLQWKKDGVGYIENTRTKQQMPNTYQLYENFMANKEKLHIQSAVKKIKIPHLIVHGTNDEVVLPIEAENIHKWNSNSMLFMLKDMNHALGNTQPWQEEYMPTDLEKVVLRSIKFIKNNIK